MKICYVLCYYFPQYVRTQTLINGLKQIKGLQVYPIINKNTGWWRYIETLSQLVQMRITQKPDLYILGFRGYELYWPVRWLTWSKPLIIDHMMSPYDSLVNEKQTIPAGGLLDDLLYRYERGLLQNATRILTDTINHQHYLAKQFRLQSEKIYPVHVSTDEQLFKPLPSARNKEYFEVFFYGSFLPLHGVSHILEAAHLLIDLPIKFHIIGGHKIDLSQFYRQIERLNLTNIIHTPWIEYQILPSVIAESDLCLGGPFGNTSQAQRIITGKTYQFLAMKKPVVVGLIEPNQGFIDKHNCLLVPQANAPALADAVKWAYSHQSNLPGIASRGYDLYQRKFSTHQISQTLKVLIDEILPT